jgi:hypothetical protein
MANRQLKFLWCSLLNNIMESVLKRLQEILRSSKGGAKWTSAFCSILGLAMCFEYIQRLTHIVCDDPTVKGTSTDQDMAIMAETACRSIDDKFQFISNLFRWKYHRGFNPLKDWMVQRALGEGAMDFVTAVRGLVGARLTEPQTITTFLKDSMWVFPGTMPKSTRRGLLRDSFFPFGALNKRTASE